MTTDGTNTSANGTNTSLDAADFVAADDAPLAPETVGT